MSNLNLQVNILYLVPMFFHWSSNRYNKYKPIKSNLDMKRPNNGPLSFWREPTHAPLRY